MVRFKCDGKRMVRKTFCAERSSFFAKSRHALCKWWVLRFDCIMKILRFLVDGKVMVKRPKIWKVYQKKWHFFEKLQNKIRFDIIWLNCKIFQDWKFLHKIQVFEKNRTSIRVLASFCCFSINWEIIHLSRN